MLNRLARRTFPFVNRVGVDPADSDDVRLQKSSLVLGSVMFIFAGALWGILYFSFGQRLAGAIPISYVIISTLSILIFHLSRRYRPFVYSQLLLILFLPFLLMIALGGFVNSSGVILWSLICPLGALLYDEPRRAIGWLAAYLGLVVVSGFLEVHPLVSSPMPRPLVTLFFVLNISAVSGIVILLLAYFVMQKDRLFGLLRVEQAKSESLLLNILPKEIAAILKNEQRTIADDFSEASVLFADMVGFTPLSARLEPVAMVELLNEAFTYFDALVDRYGVEKIRTIGDSYMAASGVPRRRPDHAQALVCMALDMRNFIAGHTFANGERVEFRIGVNSGPVIGGVIGRRKFVYDVWGDAVNVASRMESQGLGGAVQVSRATYELIKDDFICEPRGQLHVKGRGVMDVWLVQSAKPAALPQITEQGAEHERKHSGNAVRTQ
ncbi:MAG TPA: adenylate/guanylate cyclase domain-containing protein [Anaerolineales bacterium]|nr:adenylate/guanylate cyclase domain-containing protein [Anaerolineales bacterium]